MDVATGGVSEGNQVDVSTDVVSTNKVPEMKVGDTIRVVYKDVKETYPLQLGEVFSIYAVDEDGNVISQEE